MPKYPPPTCPLARKSGWRAGAGIDFSGDERSVLPVAGMRRAGVVTERTCSRGLKVGERTESGSYCDA